MPRTVSVLGLGVMGTALARALLKAGHDVTVWNRSDGPARALGHEGARVATGPGAAVAASPVTVICVLDYAATQEVLERAANELRGRLVVQLSTGSPGDARRLEGWAGDQGATYLDGAIMSYPTGIGGADSMILYSGPAEAFAATQPVRDALAGFSIHLGTDAGRANVVDHSLLSMYYGAAWGFLTGAALAGAEGLSAGELAELTIPILPVVEETIRSSARLIDKAEWSEGLAALAVHYRAVGHIVDSAAESGIDGGLLKSLNERIKARIDGGHPDDDLAGLFPVLRRS
jgi:3-hydroxyisobutyrate dehydrogenase-like beta-hydroxyacid dehydrogenase